MTFAWRVHHVIPTQVTKKFRGETLLRFSTTYYSRIRMQDIIQEHSNFLYFDGHMTYLVWFSSCSVEHTVREEMQDAHKGGKRRKPPNTGHEGGGGVKVEADEDDGCDSWKSSSSSCSFTHAVDMFCGGSTVPSLKSERASGISDRDHSGLSFIYEDTPDVSPEVRICMLARVLVRVRLALFPPQYSVPMSLWTCMYETQSIFSHMKICDLEMCEFECARFVCASLCA